MELLRPILERRGDSRHAVHCFSKIQLKAAAVKLVLWLVPACAALRRRRRGVLCAPVCRVRACRLTLLAVVIYKTLRFRLRTRNGRCPSVRYLPVSDLSERLTPLCWPVCRRRRLRRGSVCRPCDLLSYDRWLFVAIAYYPRRTACGGWSRTKILPDLVCHRCCRWCSLRESVYDPKYADTLYTGRVLRWGIFDQHRTFCF